MTRKRTFQKKEPILSQVLLLVLSQDEWHRRQWRPRHLHPRRALPPPEKPSRPLRPHPPRRRHPPPRIAPSPSPPTPIFLFPPFSRAPLCPEHPPIAEGPRAHPKSTGIFNPLHFLKTVPYFLLTPFSTLKIPHPPCIFPSPSLPLPPSLHHTRIYIMFTYDKSVRNI